MLSVQSDGSFPIKLQIKTHILLKCQWAGGDITRVEGETEGWQGIGRIASQQELSLPFPARKNFFSSSATPHRATPPPIPSVPRIPTIISSVIPQTLSEPRSNRIIPRDVATSPAPIHRRDDPPLYLPVASTTHVVATTPRSAGCRISPVWKLRKLPRSFPALSSSSLMHFCSLFCTTV